LPVNVHTAGVIQDSVPPNFIDVMKMLELNPIAKGIHLTILTKMESNAENHY
jgi:hypothetical protein